MDSFDLHGFVSFLVVSAVAVGVIVGVGSAFGGHYLANHVKWS